MQSANNVYRELKETYTYYRGILCKDICAVFASITSNVSVIMNYLVQLLILK